MPRHLSVFLAILSFLAIGCGGTSGGHSGEGRVKPTIGLSWPAGGREFSVPKMATAARIVFTGAGNDGGDLSQIVARPNGSGAIVQNIELGFFVRTGTNPMKVEFLADAGDTASVATASITVSVARNGQLFREDGQPLGVVAYGSHVTLVGISPDQFLAVGVPTDPIVLALAEGGGVVALPPGAVTYTATSGGTNVQINTDGSLTGLVEGFVTLQATVEGVTSVPIPFEILPTPIAARTVAVAANDLIYDTTRSRLWAATSGGKIQGIDPDTGGLLSSYTVGSNPSVLALSGDGTTLWTGLMATGSVCKIDLETSTVGTPFTLPVFGMYDSRYALDLSVRPGHPSTIALSSQSALNSGSFGVEIFDDGVRRTKALGLHNGTGLFWTGADRIIASDITLSMTPLRDVSIDASGATQTQTAPGNPLQSPKELTPFGDRIYSEGGDVYDLATLQKVGSFDLSQGETGQRLASKAGPVVDSVSKRAYFAFAAGDRSWLTAYNTETFALVGYRPIRGVVRPDLFWQGRRNLVQAGNHLALRLTNQIVLLDDLGGL